MSLYKQLTLLITFFLILMTTLISWFVLNYDKKLLENQMYSNARNSAAFLGLTISKTIDFSDKAALQGVVSSVVDSGYYEYVRVYDLNEKVIVEERSPIIEYDVPNIFTKFFKINAPIATSTIVNGWQNMGSLEVKIDQDYANSQMWETFIAITQIFVVCSLILLALLYVFIKTILFPLKRLKYQADAIDNNEFIIEKKLPYTPEFKSVVHAMNKTISKMEEIFNKEVKTLQKYNTLLYKDKDSGLGNKNFLVLNLNTYLINSNGILIFIELKDKISFKKSVGYKKFSSFERFIIDRANDLFMSNKDMVFTKLDDGTFAILLPKESIEDIEQRVEKLYNDIYEYIEKESLNAHFQMNLAIGISNYTQNMTIKDTLSKADQALSLAMNEENRKIKYIVENVKFTKQEWIDILEWSFENDGLIFQPQNIINTIDNTIYMQEFFVRIKNANGEIFYPAEFINTIISMNWVAKFEKNIFSKAFKYFLTKKNIINPVLNISYEFIKNSNNVNWLISELNKNFNSKVYTIFFEARNNEIINHLNEFEAFRNKLNATNHKFAIESFTFNSDNLDYLKIIKPAYLKISKEYLLEDNQLSQSAIRNIASTIGTQLIVKHIQNEEEFKIIDNNCTHIMQGKYFDRLEKNNGK